MTNQIGKAMIAGTGSYLPERILSNSDLEKMVDTSDEWIKTRTGISERHIAGDDEATSDMASEAARRAIESAGIQPSDIDMVLTATATPDMLFPCTSCIVQQNLGVGNALCFDLEAACSGFLYGLEVANRFVISGGATNVLVIGADKMSCITDWEDRSTCILFGDAAGAAVVSPATDGAGILASVSGADGSLAPLLSVPSGGSRSPASKQTVEDRSHFVRMKGNEVFKCAVRCMTDAALEVLKRCDLTVDDVDWVVPHQANMRIIRAITNRLGCPEDKVCVNVDRVGNTSAASVPVVIDESVRAGKIKRGDTVLSVVFGSGFTWGATVMKM